MRKAGEAYKCDKAVLKEKLNSFDKTKNKKDLGELLFAVCAAADAADINAEEALYNAIEEIINEA